MKNIKLTKIKDQSGVALIMTLTVLFAVLFSVFTISYIISGEVRVANDIKNSISSFYVAESGLEKGLFYLKYSRENNDYSYFTALQGFTTSTSNGGTYLISTSSLSAPDYTAHDVPTSTSAYVDIIEPPGNVDSISWGTADTYQIDWAVLNCFPDYASTRLQITLNSFQQNFSNPESETQIAVCNCSYGSDQCDTYTGAVSPLRYYRFIFRPLDVKVKQIDFSINNGGEGIPSETIIESYGSYKGSRYYMSAQVPAFSSTYDIFQYIIFSEENLNKQ